jgi:DNA-directed RNA polymerase alpha subunit
MSYNQTPTKEKDYEENGELHFILKDIHVSLANAIRRTILSDIPVIVIRTENSLINQCTILSNTTRFHNEIVKQRLSCIPIITQDLEKFPEKYS